MQSIVLTIVFAPLLGAIICGFFGTYLGKRAAHWVAILGVTVSLLLSLHLLYQNLWHDASSINFTLYEWASIGDITFSIGFLLDNLSLLMINVVNFVSLMVHIYTVGYMKDDPGYQRFFSYISLFTFAMLMLVLSNNFLQLFFGWEAVGLVSYLLIGFWFKKDSATHANLKAFLVNRVGDLGFLLGISAIFYWFGSFDYAQVFEKTASVSALQPTLDVGLGDWSALSFICICLFIGAMGKSAQVPLHVWLPDSMEGPTPISALIHAATMVTAGVFMVTRMSPLFEFSPTALTFILIVGSITALLMGLMGVIQNDIKRIIAYSTLSQLGYMVVALGASAYAAGIFHLMTHAFFKALLFLAAGSVIVALHHQQDIRKMGGLRKRMPVTYWCSLMGTLALIGMPFFSGFYSKDAIIEAVALSNNPVSQFALWALLIGVFFTALYSVRMIVIVFHGRANHPHPNQVHESPSIIWQPLVLLAIPSVIIGWWTMEPILFGDFLETEIFVRPEHDVLSLLSRDFTGLWSFTMHGISGVPFWLMILGSITAIVFFRLKPEWATRVGARIDWVYQVLSNKYYFDWFYEKVIVGTTSRVGDLFFNIGDKRLIDGIIVNGSARTVGGFAKILRYFQTGYLYHYALVMVVGLLLVLLWIIKSNWGN